METYLDIVKAYINEKEGSIKRKIDIRQLPDFTAILDRFENCDLKKLATIGLEIAPLQFWIMPASMSKKNHNEMEHDYGEVVFDEIHQINRVVKIGGKSFHTLRVCDFASYFIEADEPAVKNRYGKIKGMKYGNELTSREKDIIYLCCLWHDIFSGGEADEFNYKRRSLEHDHQLFHRKVYDPLKYLVSPDEWELILEIIETHMWKWHEQPIVKFDDLKKCQSIDEAYRFMRRYRIIRIVELSDYFAAQPSRLKNQGGKQ